MAKVTLEVDDTAFQQQLTQLIKITEDDLIDDMVEKYRNTTPRSGPPPAGTPTGGNAKKKTVRRRNSVVGNYAYAGVLDDGLFPRNPKGGYGKTQGGYSKQAPKGMATPTIAYVQKQFAKYVKKIWK